MVNISIGQIIIIFLFLILIFGDVSKLVKVLKYNYRKYSTFNSKNTKNKNL